MNAGVDDRIRADILDHLYKRPSYGNGGADGTARCFGFNRVMNYLLSAPVF